MTRNDSTLERTSTSMKTRKRAWELQAPVGVDLRMMMAIPRGLEGKGLFNGGVDPLTDRDGKSSSNMVILIGLVKNWP